MWVCSFKMEMEILKKVLFWLLLAASCRQAAAETFLCRKRWKTLARNKVQRSLTRTKALHLRTKTCPFQINLFLLVRDTASKTRPEP